MSKETKEMLQKSLNLIPGFVCCLLAACAVDATPDDDGLSPETSVKAGSATPSEVETPPQALAQLNIGQRIRDYFRGPNGCRLAASGAGAVGGGAGGVGVCATVGGLLGLAGGGVGAIPGGLTGAWVCGSVGALFGSAAASPVADMTVCNFSAGDTVVHNETLAGLERALGSVATTGGPNNGCPPPGTIYNGGECNVPTSSSCLGNAFSSMSSWNQGFSPNCICGRSRTWFCG